MNTHHAIVCIADTLDAASLPEVYKTQSNDITHIVVDRFSIADARQLSHDALQKPVESEMRVFVLVVKKLPEESQNALLKLFEDPPQHTRFYVVLPQAGMLIATLQSRVSMELDTETDEVQNETFQSFLTSSYADRMSTIAEVTKKKELQRVEDIIRGVETYVAQDPQRHTQLLTALLLVRTYARTPGASAKMLLEELALSLPRG